MPTEPQAALMEDFEPIYTGTIPTCNRPLKDVEEMIQGSATMAAKTKLQRIARRYRLDGLLELVYVRPKSRSEPHVHEDANGDISTTRMSGPSTNEAVFISNSDKALALRAQAYEDATTA